MSAQQPALTRRIATSFRPSVMGMNGAVTSGHPLASMAGLRILQEGGTAADAIVAMAAAVGVVEPNMSGVGGDGFTLYFNRSDSSLTTVNGTGPASANATIDNYKDGIPKHGPLSASIPGAVGGWMEIHRRWGKMSLADVFDPAIRLAADGFPVGHTLAFDLQQAATVFRNYEDARQVFLPNGDPQRPGQVLKQENLARSLADIVATKGESLYRGSLGQQVADAVQRNGGLIDAKSLNDFHPTIDQPLNVEYRGHQVYEPGPNSSGHVLLQELAMANHLDLSQWRHGSAELIHTMVEIKKLAFEDRERYCADPLVHGPLPDHLLTSEYAAERLHLVDANRAADRPATEEKDGDTTYLAAVDRHGNIASMTTSINGAFGSHYVAGDTGILLNNRMCYWHFDPDHPNALAPGKRVRHTVSPAILLKDGRPALAVGTPGADGQVQTVFQVIVNLIDFGMHPQQAVEAARWRSFVDGQDANWPHRHANELHLESRITARSIEALQARGHLVVREDPWALGLGSVQAIQVSEDGVLSVGSDPRRDAYGLAF